MAQEQEITDLNNKFKALLDEKELAFYQRTAELLMNPSSLKPYHDDAEAMLEDLVSSLRGESGQDADLALRIRDKFEFNFGAYAGRILVRHFIKDLLKFIETHPYTIQEDAEPDVEGEAQDDDITINLHTVDGEYEQVIIKVITIA